MFSSYGGRFDNPSGFQRLLVFLDGLEELREVALPEPSTSSLLVLLPLVILERAPYPLDNLYEYGWPVRQITSVRCDSSWLDRELILNRDY